ncbi:bifunctional phosphoribosyl-AMP cyclohydrolase/phosphoribosyl-ATP diphosphatase HisIE [Pseudoalteromonas tunicata]|jgi:phosphoribosyl-ATP pyrophosphohydrolase/phosphoribosyl-AMP cyclohydrolase|uniref:Histidine biosynthesis bifunctional protein HisIE n=1 Tax=Pseudoalteromonas tunicata D2 TaxID=87626 RepID=A4C479_9GAMM|nr:bifunctional phosphoribosyl-AMP cyclohydrolase/phosphoribosyl-ATP diphosphatase HisIE [Pseudoalteromonas tunicata]ATC97158.1 phosphoribosyl-ATP pyrophosphohydrolase / phosphoribosyl-AMP cyclohydrolase [Pseudoalteromonas tunicata]AXT33262.1 bifunctional phosphoribosyl-AMP cyclohydrolase/phosphoribosyl-ATP diphosphatase HisIE [Pseudoalteromonas tunicata]EAR30361.1 bifunctional: phosphoribosyl-AMP cyclohydrolase (N-terminal); phosphoribosyl-ATP pyrophosphatase (C-terminal) [Pseudoalteromonas tun
MKLDLSNYQNLDFAKSELIPAIVQDIATGTILMQGFMNKAALEQTLTTEKVTFYSRSKERLWTKGESSKNYLHVIDIHTDCDHDSILILATPDGPTCHLGTQSCFPGATPDWAFLGQLNRVIESRKTASPESSYTASLFAKDISRSAQKVGEEGVEVALAAVKQDREELINESADLLFHLLVLLQKADVPVTEVIANLEKRHK